MKTIKQTYVIDASVKEVWKALTDQKYINSWGGGKADMDGKKGFSFSLWGGSIWGKNLEVIPNKKLVQDWYSDTENKKWGKPSKVTFSLFHQDGKTKLELFHENVPDEDAKDIAEGWKEYYLGPLKDYLESKN